MPSPKEREIENIILEMPLQRIFSELSGIAQYQKESHVSIQMSYQRLKDNISKATEQEVVEVIDKYRKRLLDEKVRTSSGSSSLRKDNVLPSEVVKIIDKQRKKEKEVKFYQKLPQPLTKLTMKDKINEYLSPKLDELKDRYF
jgi:hypothetical protein